MRHLILSTLLLLGLTPALAASPPPLVEHQLAVHIDPATGTLEASDRLRLPAGLEDTLLLLDAGLTPSVGDETATLTPVGRRGHLAVYRLRHAGTGPLTLDYRGQIRHGLRRQIEGVGRDRQWSLGTIGSDGIFLSGASGWYPLLPGQRLRFALDVTLPAGWIAVSQGDGPGTAPESGRSQWRETQPQESIYLVAAPFTLYRDSSEGIATQVYLRAPDPTLARRYLDATASYLRDYSARIGPYPYAKFALVENFWESGYGMPSFTLLGSRVIRLPFILHTSYPHEILHNWWGNGVYVDPDSGNWSEGLTNYLADYWQRERAGTGVEARREMLKAYADHVHHGEDFPLSAFRARHDGGSQAIGYGKGAMVFHMLRRRLGDETFDAGLRRFYADNRFRAAGYAELRRAFEQVSGTDLGEFFTAWVERPGAPTLALDGVRLEQHDDQIEVHGEIRQTQPGAPFPLYLPLRLALPDDTSRTVWIDTDERAQAFGIALEQRPLALAVDPGFDVFRTLLPGETPVALGNLFGAEQGLILLPARAPAALLDGYRALAERWRSGHPGWRVALDSAFDTLPEHGAIWLLGWENRHRATFEHAVPDPTAAPPTQRLDGLDSIVLTAARGEQPLAWLGTELAEALPALARKLPHYGKYGYLGFVGARAENRLKGQWPSGPSALTHRFTPASR
ncbi:M1 family peptidase [Marichromatium gracile]|uniref:M1 family metallopeptidase n=1 Tax=Marichromatium gracile TaxID=1048 RepID=UPI001F46D843|nr:M1 family aminopeptidase [Marichromatium gracile]MCF1182583.1 M1 family peptidase [Marichromatium gracile]